MEQSYVDQTVRLCDLIPEGEHPAFLRGLTFRRCEIVGPGILVIAGGSSTFTGNTMSADMFWVLDPRRSYAGGIGVSGCTFDGCTFVGVGIAGTRDVVDSFFTGG